MQVCKCPAEHLFSKAPALLRNSPLVLRCLLSRYVSTRTERDSMGAMEVPSEALYGASTQRAVLNFPVSGYRFGREFIRALGLVKWAPPRPIWSSRSSTSTAPRSSPRRPRR